MIEKESTRATIALAISVLAIGISPVLLKAAGAPGPVAMFYRMGVAVVIMALPFYRNVKSRREYSWKGFWLAVIGGIFFSLDLGFWSTGVMLSGASKPTLFSNTAPLWVGFGAMLFFREKLAKRFWLGLGLAVAGAVIVLGLNPLALAGIEAGSLMGLASAVFYAAYFLVTQYGRRYLNAMSYTWIASASTAVALAVYTVFMRIPLSGYPLISFLLFVAMGIVGQVIGYYLINYSLGILPASLVSATLLLQPVVTTLLAVLLLGERYAGFQLGGGVVVLAGIFLIQTAHNR